MSCLTARADKEAVTGAIGANGLLLIPSGVAEDRDGHDLAVRSTACDDAVACQLHQAGAQATAASTRSVFVTESSLSQAVMAPANP